MYNFQQTIQRLSISLTAPAPSANHGGRPASVALLLYNKDDEAHLIMTRRAETLRLYPGRLTFPGGSYEPTDGTLEAAMLRELQEEVGIHSDDVAVLGRLDDRIANDYQITPFVAVLRRLEYIISPAEVAELRVVPLSALARRDKELLDLITPQTLLMIEQLLSLL